MRLKTNIIRALILSSVLMACSGGKEMKETEKATVTTPQPDWIKSRPISSGYYIGVGSASKSRSPLDYAQVAKKNALNDLASEIKVTVEGESFLNTIEHNYDFQESFQSTVITRTDEDIQDFEVVGNWENPDEYWVYYRLSKTEHARIKQEKKQNAMRSANDFFVKGKESASNQNISAAVNMHLQALEQLKPYWTETNEFEHNGETVFLDNEIYTNLLNLLENLEITPDHNEILLSHENDFTSEVNATVTENGKAVPNIPVIYHFKKRGYSRPKTLMTNNEGKISIVITDADISDPNNSLELKIDSQELVAKQNNSELAKVIAQGTRMDQVELSIKVVFPVTTIQADEKHFGKNTGEQMLANTIQKSLIEKGFRFTDQESSSDYIISLEANTSKGGTSQSFHVAYLDMSVSVRNKTTQEEVYRKGLNQIKGLQLNFDAASTEAYKKAAKMIEDEIAGDIVNTIL